MPVWVGVVATLIGLIPLVGVAACRAPRSWWWLAAAFGVSFLADLAGAAGYGMVASQTYPVLQAGLFALVLAPRRTAVGVIAGLAAVSAASLWWRRAHGLDLALHVAAFASTAVLAGRSLAGGWLRATLVAGFVALTAAWVGMAAAPGVLTWGTFQGVRLAMALGFVLAAWQATSQPGTTDGLRRT